MVRSRPGGRRGRLAAVAAHKPATIADLREFFHVDLYRINVEELDALITALLAMPHSRLYAALAGWTHPVTREWLLAADTYDLLARANSGKKKPKPYPRPWPTEHRETFGGRNTEQHTPASLWQRLYGTEKP